MILKETGKKFVFEAYPSKSIAIRAAFASLGAEATIFLHNYSFCDDAMQTLKIISLFGAKIEFMPISNSKSSKSISITPPHKFNKPKIINCGESALNLRVSAILSAFICDETKLIGEKTLLNRDFSELIEVLESLNIEVKHNNYKLPLLIKKTKQINIDNISLDKHNSSQIITGLLIASALVNLPLNISYEKIKSKGYIDLTLNTLNKFAYEFRKNNNSISFLRQNNSITDFYIEGDWSGGAFLLCNGAIKGNAVVKGLDVNSTQPDKVIFEILKSIGVNIEYNSTTILISKANTNIIPLDVDLTDTPDLFPPLATYALSIGGVSRIKGINRLLNKESNRAEAIMKIIKNVGGRVKIQDDTMIITGSKLHSAIINANGDHRIAMAAFILASQIKAGLELIDIECVNKSFPDFWQNIM